MPIDTPGYEIEQPTDGGGGGGTAVPSYSYGEPYVECIVYNSVVLFRIRLLSDAGEPASSPEQIDVTLNGVTTIAQQGVLAGTWVADATLVVGPVEGNVTVTYPDGVTKVTSFSFSHYRLTATVTPPATDDSKGTLRLVPNSNVGSFSYEVAAGGTNVWVSDATGEFGLATGAYSYRVIQTIYQYHFELTNRYDDSITVGDYTPPVVVTDFTVTQAPAKVQAVYNPINLNITKAPHKVGGFVLRRSLEIQLSGCLDSGHG